jgi:predicted dehydrogenase
MKIGFIGGWGHHYLRGLIAGGDARKHQAAVASDGMDPLAAKTLATQLGIETWFDDPTELLERFQPDIVSIGAVYAHNAERIAEALERDIPVVSDKPIATTWAQLERLTELIAGTHRTIITELPFRAQPEFRAAREAVIRNKVGSVALVTAQKSYRLGQRPDWYADRSEYGGTMLWVASHGIDAVNFSTGLPVRRVAARHGNLTKPEYGSMEDHCVVMLEMEGGAVGIVHADYLRPAGACTHGDDRLRVAGANGVVEVRDDRCLLDDGSQSGLDITDWGQTHPIHEVLLDAVTTEQNPDYCTACSLQLAQLLLICRDAADQQKELDIPSG